MLQPEYVHAQFFRFSVFLQSIFTPRISYIVSYSDYTRKSGEVQLDDVFVVEDVCSLDVLAFVNAGAPDTCEFEFFGKFPVDVLGKVVDGRTYWQGKGFVHIGFFAGRFCVNADDSEGFEKFGIERTEAFGGLRGNFDEFKRIKAR